MLPITLTIKLNVNPKCWYSRRKENNCKLILL